MKYSVFILFILFGCGYSGEKHDVIISNVNVIDVSTGKVARKCSVYIDGERITAIDSGFFYTHQADTIVDGTDKYLIPGLWDMYFTHYLYFANLNIANGVVGVCESSVDMKILSDVRKLHIGKKFIVPEVYSSGLILEGPTPDPAGEEIVKTKQEAINAINAQRAAGVNFIKVLNQLSPEVYSEIAHYTDSLGIPFFGHVPFKVPLWDAVHLKHKSIEHSMGILEACSTKSDSLYNYFNSTNGEFASWKTDVFDLLIKTFDEQIFDSLTHFLADHKVFLTPTLVAARGWSHRYDSAYHHDPRMQYIHPNLLAGWKKASDPVEIEAYGRKYEFERTLIRKLGKAGVKFLAGTDAPSFYTYPGFDLHKELQLLVGDGLTNLQALQSATINPSVFMGMTKDYGSVQPDKYASLLLLNKNPLDDIANTADINSVFIKGYYLSRHSLDSLLKVQISYTRN